MKRHQRLVFLSLFALFLMPLSGCATGQFDMDNLNVPLADLQSAIHDNMPAGALRISTNSREFDSNYFVTGPNGDFVIAKYPPKRYQTRILISGDQRPYEVIIKVAVQVRDSRGNYYTANYNKAMARVISRRIQITLHERREHRNFIDDFRAF